MLHAGILNGQISVLLQYHENDCTSPIATVRELTDELRLFKTERTARKK